MLVNRMKDFDNHYWHSAKVDLLFSAKDDDKTATSQPRCASAHSTSRGVGETLTEVATDSIQ